MQLHIRMRAKSGDVGSVKNEGLLSGGKETKLCDAQKVLYEATADV